MNFLLKDALTVFVPLNRMPLNPNGKIDKPALPFPDTAEAAQASQGEVPTSKASATEALVQRIWSDILTSVPAPIPLDESFFDLGGHSILATRLIFEIRKSFVVDAPLSLVFDHPTIRDQASALDQLRNDDLGLAASSNAAAKVRPDSLLAPGATENKKVQATVEYSKDLETLLPQLKQTYDPLPKTFASAELTVLLTGATGFLGAFILRDLLSREARVEKVICHVRASSPEKGLARLRELCADRGIWNDKWLAEKRVEVVVGDLAKENFGLGEQEWKRVAAEADVIVHNGALVRASFAFGTLTMYSCLCNLGALGLSLREAPSRQRALYAHSYQSCFNRKAEGRRFRLVNSHIRVWTLCGAFGPTCTLRTDSTWCSRGR